MREPADQKGLSPRELPEATLVSCPHLAPEILFQVNPCEALELHLAHSKPCVLTIIITATIIITVLVARLLGFVLCCLSKMVFYLTESKGGFWTQYLYSQ